MEEKKKEKNDFIVITKSSKSLVMDQTHIIAIGTTEILKESTMKKYYHETAFSFEYLERAELYFKAIHGNLYDKSKLRCMISHRNAPVIFIYSTQPQNQVFALAPRKQGVDD